MDSTHPLFSILIVNYNGLHHLPECLESLYAQTLQDFEIVMVDNASKDGSLTYLREHHPRVKLIESRVNFGFAGGNNFGYPHCQGEWIFFLNNDTRCEPDCLEKLAEAARTLDAGAIACLMLDYYHPERVDNGGDMLYTAGPAFSNRNLPASDPLYKSPRRISLACGGASAWKRSVLEEIGLFDEDFFLNFEDVDLSFRTSHAGYKIWMAPAAKVHHKGSATIGHYTRTSVFHCSRNMLWVRIKNYPAPIFLRHLIPMFATAVFTFGVMLVRGAGHWWIEGRLQQIPKIPRMLSKRKQILAHSKISAREFNALLRPNWFVERVRVTLARRKANAAKK